MDTKDDANWWTFSIPAEERGQVIKFGPGGLREVNPALPDGRRSLDYQTYIGLERLLTCQVPSSRVPDERAFIITHQLFEIVFKLMIFDLAVISETFQQLLSLSEDEPFLGKSTQEEDSGFWRPALTASARLKYSSSVLLPAFIGYLFDSEEKDETFSSLEFYRFRNYLPPASGFQTAQYRLIQRGLGKSNLLSVRLFPGDQYWKNYEGREDQGPVSVIDPVVLRKGVRTALPPENSPEVSAAELDDRGHQVLNRLSRIMSRSGITSGRNTEIRRLAMDEIDSAVEAFKQILAGHRSLHKKNETVPPDAEAKDQEAEMAFSKDLVEAARRENERRQKFKDAVAGAQYLQQAAQESCLFRVLSRVREADQALYGSEEKSFISVHYRMAAKRISDLIEHAQKIGKAEPPAGTGGGGVPYLWLVRKHLIPLFPALVGFRARRRGQNA
jgi:tryptophan 2,3-dioxygenase